MSDSPKEVNLARIRDNQRRSRARRKEYVQELEQRLREAESRRAQASADIQLAARKVVDENKKLRTLLNRHGVRDESIDAFLRSDAEPLSLSEHHQSLQTQSSRSYFGEDSRTLPPIVSKPLSDVTGAGCHPPHGISNTGSKGSPHYYQTLGGYQTRLSPALSTSSTSEPADAGSCSMAADLISSMTGADPHKVRESLGCAPGTDCMVKTETLGNTINELTANAGGMC